MSERGTPHFLCGKMAACKTTLAGRLVAEQFHSITALFRAPEPAGSFRVRVHDGR